MIPSSNLLNMALTIIAKQTVTYFQYTGRTTNAIGYDVASFAAGIDLLGSWQPVPRDRYEYLGLDFQRNYVTFYVSKNILDIQRDVSGDQIEYNGKRWQCQSSNDWYAVDGWVGILCVEIDNA